MDKLICNFCEIKDAIGVYVVDYGICVRVQSSLKNLDNWLIK